MRYKITVLLFSVLLLSGCSTWYWFWGMDEPIDWQGLYENCEKNAKLWIGVTENYLIMQKGRSPYDEQKDGAGGKIVIYLERGHLNKYNTWKILYRAYYINPEGKVYHIRCYMGS
jgi:hypothetical protein